MVQLLSRFTIKDYTVFVKEMKCEWEGVRLYLIKKEGWFYKFTIVQLNHKFESTRVLKLTNQFKPKSKIKLAISSIPVYLFVLTSSMKLLIERIDTKSDSLNFIT